VQHHLALLLQSFGFLSKDEGHLAKMICAYMAEKKKLHVHHVAPRSSVIKRD
jgi:hypothetical protein